MSLQAANVTKKATSKSAAQQQEERCKEGNFNKIGEALEQPQSVKGKPSYKQAVDELYDGQQATEDCSLSPPRKKNYKD